MKLQGIERKNDYLAIDISGAILDSRDKIITLDSDGKARKIRINNRSIAPLNLRFETTIPFYGALSAFHNILESARSQFRFLLRPGDLLLLDNERVLHGRACESMVNGIFRAATPNATASSAR